MISGIVTILFFVISGWQDPMTEPQAESLFRRGVELQQSGDPGRARQAYEAALRLAPDRIDILSNLGVVCARLGRYDEAVIHYRRALTLRPNEARIRLNLGIAHFQLRQFRDVITQLTMVREIYPNHTQSRLLLGISHYELRELNEAIGHLEAVHTTEPGDVSVAHLLALACLDSGLPAKIERAGDLVRTIFRELPTAEAGLVRGSYALARRDLQSAISNLSEALRLNPGLSAARIRLGAAWLLAGNREAAIAAYADELATNRDNIEATSRLGWLYREEGRLDEAEPLLKWALDRRPDDPGLLYQLARLHYTRRQLNSALPLAERLTVLAPRYRPGRVLLSRLYFRLGRPADARREKEALARLTGEQVRSSTAAEANNPLLNHQP